MLPIPADTSRRGFPLTRRREESGDVIKRLSLAEEYVTARSSTVGPLRVEIRRERRCCYERVALQPNVDMTVFEIFEHVAITLSYLVGGVT